MRLLLGLTVYASYLQALPGMTAPFLAADLGLDDARITAIAGFVSIGAFGTAALARMADRHGRRGLVVLCFALLPVLSLASALAPGIASYTVAQIGVSALMGALFTGIVVVMIERASESRRAAGQAWFGLASATGGGLAVGLAALGDQMPWGWRGFWLVAALPLLAIEPVRRAHATTATSRLRARAISSTAPGAGARARCSASPRCARSR